MQTERNRIQSWVRDYLEKRYPDLVLPVLRAADAFDRAQAANGLEPRDLAILAEASRSSRTPLSENAAGLVGRLANRFEQARDLILDMSTDPKVHVRINALVALESLVLGDLHILIARRALGDRSARVRALAASKICGWNLGELLPALEEAIVTELDVARRCELEWSRDLLRDGYTVNQRTDGSVWFTCKDGRGGVVSRWFTADELNRIGIAGLARMLGVELQPLRTAK